MELNSCAGRTQTLLSKLSANIKIVCLASIDYAALSTKPDDIRTLVNNYSYLECIVVDRLRETGKYEVYSILRRRGRPHVFHRNIYRCIDHGSPRGV
ncbi:hypothetical protein G6F70_001560 [Rhizopus microsporus]|nr:hypothetical protein G6F71_001829 [Rhizopus microsporus]KAG1203262.1 hypothetical protein G6F70_001560 [Rhizopus microsporus]KAG1216362.1 hypothetical protein G6F69_000124 [Rhizopus microsporus]KAG1238381.1 hypothetical protein G6F67_000468 [Rhizopus microsporus]KAG1269006.1 hypothetical protein G6F68_000641 [Rhizopus microsporus]